MSVKPGPETESSSGGDRQSLTDVQAQLAHARAALRHIARTCTECPETASFACAAAEDPPAAFAPAEDYGELCPGDHLLDFEREVL